MRDAFETGNTVQFTFTSSVAPDSSPYFIVTGPGSASVVASISATQSDSTHYYALFTMPTTLGVYMGEWHAIKTVVGSTYDFRKRFLFNVVKTTNVE